MVRQGWRGTPERDASASAARRAPVEAPQPGRTRAAAPALSRGRRAARWLTPYLFLAPAVVLLGVFSFWPAVTAVTLAFYRYDFVNVPEWVGLGNFASMAGDPRFWLALRNSLLFLAGMIPLNVVLPLFLALLVNRRLAFVKTFRLLYYLPVVTSMVVVAIAWEYVFHREGVVNWLLVELGVLEQPIQYFLDPTWALPALILVEGWKTIGYYMIIYLAGLQSLPDAVLEAAAVDGAGPWARVRYVVVPLLRPFIMVCLVLTAISSMQVFTSIFVITQGGPLDATLTLGYYIYLEAFERTNVGYASTMGVALWVILIVLAFVNYRLTRSEEGQPA